MTPTTPPPNADALLDRMAEALRDLYDDAHAEKSIFSHDPYPDIERLIAEYDTRTSPAPANVAAGEDQYAPLTDEELDAIEEAREVAEIFPMLAPQPSAAGDADSLFAAIQHGDDVHREWLREALHAWFNGKPVPPVRSAPPAVSAPAVTDNIAENGARDVERWIAAVAGDGSLAGAAAAKCREIVREVASESAERARSAPAVTDEQIELICTYSGIWDMSHDSPRATRADKYAFIRSSMEQRARTAPIPTQHPDAYRVELAYLHPPKPAHPDFTSGNPLVGEKDAQDAARYRWLRMYPAVRRVLYGGMSDFDEAVDERMADMEQTDQKIGAVVPAREGE